eukprot:2561094-Amphidinium_carterae.1
MPPATSLQKLSANWMTIPGNAPNWITRTHAAQLAASQSSDGSVPSASAAIASAAQRKLQKNQKQPLSTLPSSMPTVPEEVVPPSDQESFRSADEQSEPVTEE